MDKSLHDWFGHNNGGGGGWIDCKLSRKGKLVPCGRSSSTGTKRKYPACRPKLSMCNGAHLKKRGHKTIKWTTKK